MTTEIKESRYDVTDIFKIVLSILWALVVSAYYIGWEVAYLFVKRPAKSLKGHHVLVTGAGRGLGREIALRFARENCHVTCVDIDKKGSDETAQLINEAYGDKSVSYKLDVTNRDQVEEFAERLEKEHGPVDVLVNNAGIVQGGSILELTNADIERMLEVNLVSHFWTVRAFLPRMEKQRRGHIVGISSVAALTVAANIVPYTATKCAVSGLMGCLREELRQRRSPVKITTVHPFFITPPQSSPKHWEIRSVLPDVTAEKVADVTVEGVKQDRYSITIPTYMYFTLHLLKVLPAAASDLWREVFAARINGLSTKAG